jgi:hypothetical protein
VFHAAALIIGGCLVLAFAPFRAGAQAPSPVSDPLQPIAFMIGRWQGTSQGQPGNGTLEREYVRILNSRFIQERSRSVYPAQDRNPKGETHEHVSIFSFDKSRGRIVFRQFHTEGFVNQYIATTPALVDGTIVFTSEAIENIPAGWRARETYVRLGPDELEELFELAEPGKDFEPYSRAKLTRVR